MDSLIRVALYKGTEFVTALTFRDGTPDSELQEFAELHSADTFRRLSFNEFVDDSGQIVVVESPFPSWIWSVELGRWAAPVDQPQDKATTWDEDTQSWVETPVE